MLLTTQYLDEADRLADTIVIIDHGAASPSAPRDELKSRVGRDVIDVKVGDDADLAPRRRGARAPRPCVDTGAGRVSVPVTTGADDLVAAVQALGAADIALDDIALRRPTLDDVFLTLTGHTTDRVDRRRRRRADPEEVAS